MAAVSNIREEYAKYKRYFRRIADTYYRRPSVKASVELLLTLLTISFFAIFALRPTLNTIAELWANIASQKETSRALEEKLSNLGRAQLVFSQEEQRLALLNEALPNEPRPDQYLQQIEGLVATHGLSLESFNIDETLLLGKPEKPKGRKKDEKEIPNVENIPISFSVSGDFSSLISFLEDTENLRRLIVIESLSFGAGTGRRAGSLLLTIAGGVPYYQE